MFSMIVLLVVIALSSFMSSFYGYKELDGTYNISNRRFPKNFLFGVSSSSFQTEGAWLEDGKGLTYMDYLYHTNCYNNTNPQEFNRVCNTIHSADGKNGDIASDSYHKWQEDILLLKKLGVDIYRFSISWARILPDGTLNNINKAGIDYYLRFIKKLKANGIEPFVTLFHDDTPLNLYKMDAWLKPQIIKHFGDYARLCFKHFGEYVKFWGSINEAGAYCLFEYEYLLSIGKGEYIYQCGKNLLLAHATAYHIYHDEFAHFQHGKISLVIDATTNIPASSSKADLMAAERATAFKLGWFAHPIYIGDWPEIMKQRVYNRSIAEGYSSSRLPALTAQEIAFVKGTADYFALNSYSSSLVADTEEPPLNESSYANDIGVSTSVGPEWKQAENYRLYSYPPGMRIVLNYIWKTYHPGEIVIAENGWPTAGELHDPDRIDYLQGYLSNVLTSILDDGVNVIGYSMWSFMDSLEWTSGYTIKFGLVHVDFDSPNRTRTFRHSAYWYQKLCSTHCLTNDCFN